MTVDYNPSDKWPKTVMKANEKNCQITSEKGIASSNIVQEATRQALESIDY